MRILAITCPNDHIFRQTVPTPQDFIIRKIGEITSCGHSLKLFQQPIPQKNQYNDMNRVKCVTGVLKYFIMKPLAPLI